MINPAISEEKISPQKPEFEVIDPQEDNIKSAQKKHVQNLENILRQVSQRQPLKPEQRKILENLNAPHPYVQIQKDAALARDNLNKGKELTQKEQNSLYEMQKLEREVERQRSEANSQVYADLNEKYANDFEQDLSVLGENGIRIIPISDTHSTAEETAGIFAERIQDKRLGKNKLEDGAKVLFCGDMLPDLIDQSRYGLDAYLANTIAEEGELNKEETEDFKKNYLAVMKAANLNEDNFIRKQINQEKLQEFMYILYGLADPRFMTRDEIMEFRQKRETVLNYIKTATKRQAETFYSKMTKYFNQLGLTEKNLVITPGNHDCYQVMKKHLGKYIIEEGKTRDLEGILIGSATHKSEGAHMGPNFSDTFNYDLKERLSELIHENEMFKALLEEHRKYFPDTDENTLERLMMSVGQRAALGLGGRALMIISEEIQDGVYTKAKNYLKETSKNIPKDADIIIGHGDPTNPQRVGLEEAEVARSLRGMGKTYVHGHIHGNTTHRQDGNTYINFGSARAGSGGEFIFDTKNKSVYSVLSETMKKDEGNRTDLQYLTKNQIPSQRTMEKQAA